MRIPGASGQCTGGSDEIAGAEVKAPVPSTLPSVSATAMALDVARLAQAAQVIPSVQMPLRDSGSTWSTSPAESGFLRAGQAGGPWGRWFRDRPYVLGVRYGERNRSSAIVASRIAQEFVGGLLFLGRYEADAVALFLKTPKVRQPPFLHESLEVGSAAVRETNVVGLDEGSPERRRHRLPCRRRSDARRVQSGIRRRTRSAARRCPSLRLAGAAHGCSNSPRRPSPFMTRTLKSLIGRAKAMAMVL